MKAWLLFFLGTLAYFINRYNGRKNKLPEFDLVFWIKDNWPELILTVIIDLAAMIILMDAGTAVDMSTFLSKLPIGIVLSGKLALSFACGFGLGAGVYQLFKKKCKDAEK